MIIDPSKVKFENTNDVVDYIVKGLPPTRKQFDKLMFAVENPVDKYNQDTVVVGRDVIICRQDIENWNSSEYVQQAVSDVLRRVYRDRVIQRNIAIAVGVGVLVGGIVIVANSDKEKS